MPTFLKGFMGALVIGGILAAGLFWLNDVHFTVGKPQGMRDFVGEKTPMKSKQELIAEAMERSAAVRGLYMTADVANDPGAAGTRLREKIIQLADATQINGIVVDVKEVCGPDYNPTRLKSLLGELHQKNLWVIARIVTFKDGSEIQAHPEWYVKRKAPLSSGDECASRRHLRAPAPGGKKSEGILWQDKHGGYWLDPASSGAREYILSFAKQMIDLGFDELQFDYLRFPSDGDVRNAIYPAWDHQTPKYLVMKSFFEFLNQNLKAYKPNVILSADLFGYVAAQKEELSIGQRLEDIGSNFDYISFMVYPSHYYNGLELPASTARHLPAVHYTPAQARQNPGVVVERSLLVAREYLDSIVASTTASSTPLVKPARHSVRFRPWLEDFFHEEDKVAGRPYGVEKVRMQMDAAERVEPHGWLLWNAANVYTGGVLKKE